MGRVSYHQSLFDLLDLRPTNSAEATALIEACERRRGRMLPESVRQWYRIEKVVPLRTSIDGYETWSNAWGHLWFEYSNTDLPETLPGVLEQFADVSRRDLARDGPRRIPVLMENQAVCNWFVELDGSDDPPVVVDEHYDRRQSRMVEWVRVADHFSEFLFNWFRYYYARDWTPLSEKDRSRHEPSLGHARKRHLNGLWLYAPRAAALEPPHLDFLIEHLTETDRIDLGEGFTQYRFRGEHGRVRVTSDAWGGDHAVSAWWLHADSADGLFALVQQVIAHSALLGSLRAATEQARPVMERLGAPDNAQGTS